MNDSNQVTVALVNMVENYKGLGVSPPSFADEDRRRAVTTLEALGAVVVLNELVCDPPTANNFVSSAIKTNFDALIMNVIGWPGGDPALIIGRAFDRHPLMLWTTPTVAMALCGYFEITSDLKSIAKEYVEVLGKEDAQRQEINSFLKAVTTAKKLKGMKIAQIGYTPPGFVDATGYEEELRKKLGVDIVRLDVSEILTEVQKISVAEAEEALSQIRYTVKVGKEELLKSVKVSLALQKLFAKNQLKAGALRCLPELQGYAFPCLGVSRLTDDGKPVTCEGDLPAAITLAILQELTGNVSTVFDCDSIGTQDNVVNLWHCGQLPTSLAASEKEIVVMPPTYLGQVNGPGAILSFSVKPGKVTLAKLDRRGEKMLIASGSTVTPDNPPEGAYARVKLDTNVLDFVRTVSKEGIEHHICLAQGNVTAELAILCMISGIQPIKCS